MDVELCAWIQSTTGALDVTRAEHIQSLWGGYGEIIRVCLERADGPSTAIVKWVKPPPARALGHSASDAVSHARKCRSYDVELAFYREVASRTDDACATPQLLGARTRELEWVLLLTDLDAAGYSARHRSPRGNELLACLDWLAAFHARFAFDAADPGATCSARSDALWSTGTYWHLDTRRDELRNIQDVPLRALAEELDRRLGAARFRTLVHGDAKPANFCFTPDGRRVAALDFQYAGGGIGPRDVAYLLHGLPCAAQAIALNHYFARLRSLLPATLDGDSLEAEWRILHPVAARDFERFLAGWGR